MKNTLSLNDLALAQFACGHAINWTKAQGRSSYWRAERQKFEALNKRLSDIQDLIVSNDVPDEVCDLAVLRIDAEVGSKIRRAALALKSRTPHP